MIREETLNIMGIIGIRSGSKSIPNKNIRYLIDKPLIGWILETAKQSQYINRLIVSTDSPEYAKIASSYGAEIPCLRPSNISSDNSTDFEYVQHMVNWLKKNENYNPDIIVRMMATVPLQLSEDIDNVVEKVISDPSADSAVVISEARQHPRKALKIVDDGFGSQKLVSYIDESASGVNPTLRQDYDKAYFRSNVIALRTSVLSKTKTLTGDLIRFHIIPQDRAIDIDTEIDFELASTVLRLYSY